MSNTSIRTKEFKQCPQELLSEEADKIAKRRRHVLSKQLCSDELASLIEELSLEDGAKSDLKKLVNDYLADPNSQQLTAFNNRLDGLSANLSDMQRPELEKLFVRLLPDQNPLHQTNGLALSGGGIRSAAFNLGVLQALKHHKLFKQIDYLSTVSGGGYIGSSLTYFLHHPEEKDKENYFPFDDNDIGHRHVSWIRRHASYLTPGGGLNMWSLAAAALRGILINQFFLIPLWLGLFWIFVLGIPDATGQGWLGMLKGFMEPVPIVILLFVTMAFQSLLRRSLNTHAWNEASDRIEDRPTRIVLWIGLFAAFSLAYGESLYLPWNEQDLTFKLIPSVLLLTVWAASLIGFLTRLEQKFVELMEIATWMLVLWLLYALMPLLTETLSLDVTLSYPPAFLAVFLIGISLLLKLAVNYLFYALFSSGKETSLDFNGNRYFSVQYGDLLVIGTSCVLFGVVPLVDHYLFQEGWLKQWSNFLISGITAGGVVSTLLGWFKRNRENELSGLVPILLRLGVVLLVIAATLLSYRWAVGMHDNPQGAHTAILSTWFAFFVILAAVTDINAVSMHSYYRNRLLEAFMRDKERDPASYITPDSSDNLALSAINVEETGAPYHLINAHLVTVGSDDNKLRLRAGANFIFSPHNIGSEPTGWITTDRDYFKQLSLATAMAVSGAAVDPNTGETRSWPLRLIMTWFNLRLGYWCPNPNPSHCQLNWLTRYVHGSWLLLILKEILGKPGEKWTYIRLSDGGHFENLGVYELLRRQCKLIIVSDAGADPDFAFSDLSRAIERARVDFGVHINKLNTDKIQPERIKTCKEKTPEDDCFSSRLAELPYACGKIEYRSGKQGRLIYIKSTLFPDLSEDMLGYARQHQTFPDETTADQFFSEEQFEAYRELGYRSMAKALKDLPLTWSGEHSP